MDAATAAVIIAGLKYVGQPSAEVVKDFLSRILAPTADSIGRELNSSFLEWRQRKLARGVETIQGAAQIVLDSGAEPQPVPGRILGPLMEKASVEEDEELHKRWTALLASAAIEPNAILPAFVSVLGELSPIEARLLREIYRWSLEYEAHSRYAPPNSLMNTQETYRRSNEILEMVRDTNLMKAVGITDSKQFFIYQLNLERLQLVHQGGYPGSTWEEEHIDWPIVTTAFGDAFVAACMTPAERKRVAAFK